MAKSAARRRARTPRRQARMVFARTNYLLLGLCVALVVVGFTAMRIENEVDGFVSLVAAPLLVLGGYLGVIGAILRRPKDEPDLEAS